MYYRFPSGERFQLEWLQPQTFGRYFELLSGQALLGTLSWERMLSDLAKAETRSGAWTIQHRGLLNQQVDVREARTERLLATFYPKLMGNGVLEFVDGRELEWEPTNFWTTNWSFFAPGGAAVVAFVEGVESARWKDMFKTQMTVTVDRSAWSGEEVEVLVMLGLYLIISRQEQAAGAVAATSAAVT